MGLRVLIIQSDKQSAEDLNSAVKNYADQVLETQQIEEANILLQHNQVDVVFLDAHFPEDDWQQLLKQIKNNFPAIRVVMTNKYPDLKGELIARELGVQVFLRQPFNRRWVEYALNRVQMPEEHFKLENKPQDSERSPDSLPRVYFPVRFKITLPYLVLAILFALATSYVINQVVFDSVQDRYLNQLIATGRQGTDWMVREEDRLLSTLRLVANTQGVSDALQNGETEVLRNLVLPLAVNAEVQSIVLLDMQGISRLSLYQLQGSTMGEYQSIQGETNFMENEVVKMVLQGASDDQGDKYAGLLDAAATRYFYVLGPVYGTDGTQVGVILVGNSLQNIANRMQSEILAAVSLYDSQGNPLISTLFTEPTFTPVPSSSLDRVISGQLQNSVSREADVNGVSYTELLGRWMVRNGQNALGVIGISLPQAFLVQTSQVTRFQVFGLSLLGVFLIILVGLWLARRITHPLDHLVEATSQVAEGTLDIKVDSKGNDEIAVLAHSFNSMIAGLQEGSMYRDLLGRTVSPEVREQLRQTFSSRSLRLEGQEAVATVLMTDVRGFTTLSEKASPTDIFEWLNDYYDELIPIIVKHGGVVNKMDGDAILAFFGILPKVLSPQESALAGCSAAAEIFQVVEKINKKRQQKYLPLLLTGIGVHTGEVVAGGLGSRDRMQYTIIGDTVNTTQRLESLTRALFNESGVLISEATYQALESAKKNFDFEPIGYHSLKGKEEKIMVYSLQLSH